MRTVPLRPAITLTTVLCLLTGVAYPGLVTVVAQLLFPFQANGSLLSVNGEVRGSALIGQRFTEDWYFHSRPASAGGYDGMTSGGSNKGPSDRALADTVASAVAAVVRVEGGTAGAVPSDMVTRSASGLDPHISPANAALQVARVSRARGISRDDLRQLVARHTELRQLGVFGEPRVHVLRLNLALDSAAARRVR